MKLGKASLALAAAVLCTVATNANAQTTVTPPDTGLTTTRTAVVSEQANVAVPGTVSLAVTDITSATPASGATITVGGIVLGTTWSAGDVTWNGGSWTNATGVAGTLSSGSFGTVATCTANVVTCSTTGLLFALGANPGVQRAGNHTLLVTWKFEAIGS